MKVLVTGANGFLGSHLVDRLVAENEEVVALDPTNGRGFITNNARIYRQDYSSGGLEKIFEKERPEFVCHFASEDTIVTSFERPVENANHVLFTLLLLEQCKRFQVKRVIYASSAAVYGNPQYLPCDEVHPTHPVSPLGVTQQTVESYLYFYWVNFGLDHTILRAANVYGPRQTAGRQGGIVSTLIDGMLRKQEVILNGDGMQERDFLFFSDYMDATMAALRLSERQSKRAAPTDFIFNIGRGESCSIMELFSTLGERIPYPRKPVRGPQRPCEVFVMSLDPSRSMKTLGWKPKVSLAEGLDRTILWFKKELKIK